MKFLVFCVRVFLSSQILVCCVHKPEYAMFYDIQKQVKILVNEKKFEEANSLVLNHKPEDWCSFVNDNGFCYRKTPAKNIENLRKDIEKAEICSKYSGEVLSGKVITKEKADKITSQSCGTLYTPDKDFLARRKSLEENIFDLPLEEKSPFDNKINILAVALNKCKSSGAYTYEVTFRKKSRKKSLKVTSLDTPGRVRMIPSGRKVKRGTFKELTKCEEARLLEREKHGEKVLSVGDCQGFRTKDVQISTYSLGYMWNGPGMGTNKSFVQFADKEDCESARSNGLEYSHLYRPYRQPKPWDKVYSQGTSKLPRFIGDCSPETIIVCGKSEKRRGQIDFVP